MSRTPKFELMIKQLEEKLTAYEVILGTYEEAVMKHANERSVSLLKSLKEEKTNVLALPPNKKPRPS